MESNIKFELKLDNYSFDINEITTMLSKMFKDKDVDKIVLEPEEKTFKVTAYDEIGKVVRDTVCPPNIKEGTVLGFYCNKYNLCLMPLKNKSFVLKKGCRHNKTVRPLFSLYKMKKEKYNEKYSSVS